MRCNVGGPNTCSYSCRALGHTGGACDDRSADPYHTTVQDTHLFAKFLLGRMNSQISIFTYLLFLASTGGAPWVHFWLPASIGEIFRLVKVVLPPSLLGVGRRSTY